MPPAVAIVILNWNGKNFLQTFLPSVIDAAYPGQEVYVIDNASTDDSISFLREQFPAVHLIALPANLGFAKGYNEGLKSVTADYYVLLNSDVEVTAGWIAPIIAWMEKDRSIAACQPKILQYGQKDQFEYAGAAGGWIDVLGYPFARGRIFDFCETDKGQYDAPATVCWASGAALFIRAHLFHQMGGFDGNFHAHMEEIDLCWRLQAEGYNIGCCPRAVVYHVGGGSLPKGNPQKVYLNFRNNLIMLAKNLPLGLAIGILPLRLILDLLAACKHLFSGEPAHFKPILQAQASFIAWLCTNKKKYLFPSRKALPRHGLYKGSIVWKHFIRGARTFSEIVR